MRNSLDQQVIEIVVAAEFAGERIDKFLSNQDGINTRSRAENLIKSNLVQVNGKVVRSSFRVSTADKIFVHLPSAKNESIVEKLDLDLDIRFEDEFLLVVNKPPGLVVHPAAGHESDTLVNALVNYSSDFLMKFKDQRPGLVHRIDKDTSGLLVVAKNDFVLESLAQQFKDRSTHRIYQSIVIGKPQASSGKITSYLARHPVHRKKYASVLGADHKVIRSMSSPPYLGKWAATNYRTLKVHPVGISLLELKLETGRTHQIRVHLSESGLPILSDEIYGSPSRQKKIGGKELQAAFSVNNRCALHAMELGFTHPITKQTLEFKVDWPDYSEVLSLFRE